jgi:hypothetical protein
MKNLYDKLLPELKQTLLLNQKKYPSVCKRIIATLKYKDYYGDLTIEELKNICTFTGVDWNKVEWKFGEDLFGKISKTPTDVMELVKKLEE